MGAWKTRRARAERARRACELRKAVAFYKWEELPSLNAAAREDEEAALGQLSDVLHSHRDVLRVRVGVDGDGLGNSSLVRWHNTRAHGND